MAAIDAPRDSWIRRCRTCERDNKSHRMTCEICGDDLAGARLLSPPRPPRSIEGDAAPAATAERTAHG